MWSKDTAEAVYNPSQLWLEFSWKGEPASFDIRRFQLFELYDSDSKRADCEGRSMSWHDEQLDEHHSMAPILRMFQRSADGHATCVCSRRAMALLARKSVPAGWTLALFVSKPADTFVHANVCLCRPAGCPTKKIPFEFLENKPITCFSSCLE